MTQLNSIAGGVMGTEAVEWVEIVSTETEARGHHTLGPRDRGKRCFSFTSRPSRT